MIELSRQSRWLALAVASSGLLALGPSVAASMEPFTEEAAARGLLYVIQDYPQATGYLGFGIAFADLDGDHDADLIVLGAADGHVGLFENDGTGNFTDRSVGSGIPFLAEAGGLAAGDVDGDGDLDLYLTQLGNDTELMANVLALNEGGFTFSDGTAAAGVGDLGAGQGPAFGDFDGDGWLDLYVANYNGIVAGTDLLDNVLYRNLGDGTFEDVSVAQTVDDHGRGFQSVWFDYDRDGDVDLYLSNDRGHIAPLFRTNQLWRNDDGALINVSVGSGADVGLFSMGIACGDLDGNRWPDLYVTNNGDYKDGFNPLLLNGGLGQSPPFVESSAAAGVDHWTTSWGSIFFDFDNDTHQDLFVNNMFVENTLYDCNVAFPCTELLPSESGVGGRAVPNVDVSFASAVADVDLDGDLDLVVNSLSGNVELFINQEGDARTWIRYRMEGLAPNLFAVGGSVDTRVGSAWQLREVLAGGNGYLGQNELPLHVGLDQATSVDEVVVVWPGGAPTRILTDLPAERTWTLYPPDRLGDADGAGVVDLDDFFAFSDCYEVPLEPGCEVMDFDGNSAVAEPDIDGFLTAYDAVLADCNGNGTPDLREILLGQEADTNSDGVPDSCEIFADGFESGDTSAWSTTTG